MSIKPIETNHSSEWHMAKFIEFCQAKISVGEPMAHLKLVQELSKDVSDTERLWRVGLYLNAWSVTGAEWIFGNWSYADYVRAPAQFAGWLTTHWPGVHTRKERRMIRSPDRFLRCLTGYCQWMQTDFPTLRAGVDALSNDAEYTAWWDSMAAIPYFGRYILCNGLESMRQIGHMRAHLFDLRALGADSPIRGLVLMRQDAADELLSGSPTALQRIGHEVYDTVQQHIDEPLGFFRFGAFLCENRQMVEHQGEYVGNSHDEEIEYQESRYAKYGRNQGFKSGIYAARKTIFPPDCLGELMGWNRIRNEVANYLQTHGVVWSDLVYDYHQSIVAGYPVPRTLD